MVRSAVAISESVFLMPHLANTEVSPEKRQTILPWKAKAFLSTLLLNSRLFNSLNGISHIVGFLENTLILDQSSIHHVCCIYLSCNLVFFQMIYKTIQITK